MTPEQLVQIGHDADEALQRGETKRALSLYVQLESHQPKNPRWPTGSALALRKFGQRAQEIEALLRAAKLHLESGDQLRGISVLKQVLAIDGQHAEARRALSMLHQRSTGSRPRVAAASSAPVAPVAWKGKAGAPLDQVPLHEVMPGAVPRGRMSSTTAAGTYRLALGDDPGLAPLEIEPGPAHFVPPPQQKQEDFSLEDAALDLVARETKVAQRVQQVLPSVPLFAELGEAGFDRLIQSAEILDVDRNKEIFHQGARGDALFVICEGLIGMVEEGPPRRGIAKLGPGEIFGEIALLTDRPRTATAMALAPTQLIAIDRAAVSALLAQEPAAVAALLRFIKNRLVDRLLATHPLFTVLTPADRERLKARFRVLESDPGSVLITEGKPADGLIVFLTGHAEVIRGRERIGVLEPGDIAGEMSLLQQTAAIATVRTTVKSLAVELGGQDFLRIISSRPEAKSYVEQLIQSRRAALRWG